MPKLQIIEDGKKECTKCGETLPLENFRKRTDRRGYTSECKDCKSSNDKEWYKQNKESARNNYFKGTYGITTKDVERLKVEQDYKCAICDEEESGRGLFVDHDHDTGEVRGLLCHHCNSGLGMAKDNVEILKNMIKYLEKERG